MLLGSFIEIALEHGCSPVNLLIIFRTPFSKNSSGIVLSLLLTLAPKSMLVGHKINLVKQTTKFLNRI